MTNYFFYNTDSKALREQPRPRYPVLIENGFAAVGGDRHQFGEQLADLSPDDILLMYENGVGVVAVGLVVENWDGATYSTPSYYLPSELEGLSGGPFEYRIAVDWFLDLSASPITIELLRGKVGYTPRGAIQKVIERRTEVISLLDEVLVIESLMPGELPNNSTHIEGAVRQVLINAYERSQRAVAECKRKRGTKCLICGLDFGTLYGEEFAGFIHVHHLLPLSEIGVAYMVDPVVDLCPVCPNCHAVIHHGGKMRSVDEVRALLEHQRNRG